MIPIDQKRIVHIEKARKVVLKLGTRVLLSHHNDMNKSRIEKLVDDIVAFRNQGYQFSIVTSGAVGFGMNLMGVAKRPTDLKKIQALASIGQSLLMQKWNRVFSRHDIHVGQILLTYDVIENRKRFLYARDCLNALIEYGIIPVVNENDSVAVDELKFGDNDTLSALTAHLMDADLLVLFTDTDGIYTGNPHENAQAMRISYVDSITEELFKGIEDAKNDLSIGGMKSKLMAADFSVKGGTAVVIAEGYKPNLKAILEGRDVGTFIRPDARTVRNKKRWIFSNQKIKGKIYIDRGAEEAIVHRLKSLLPGGVVKTEKNFAEGSIVGIYNLQEKLVGKGISYFSGRDLEKIKGHKTDEIKKILGEDTYEEVVHRDNLIIL